VRWSGTKRSHFEQHVKRLFNISLRALQRLGFCSHRKAFLKGISVLNADPLSRITSHARERLLEGILNP